MPDAIDEKVLRLLKDIAMMLVDWPEYLSVTAQRDGDATTFLIQSHPGDIENLIGKQGRNAQSLRTILQGVGWNLRRTYRVEIIEP